MKRSIFALAVAAMMILAPAVVASQKGGPKGPKVKVSHGPKVKSSPAPVTKAHGPKTMAKAQGPKTTKVQGPKASKTHGKPAAKAVSSASTTTGGAVLTLSPVQQKLQKNTNLASKLERRLPPGTNLLDAADGFRNLGQFVAAVNVSNNLDIPFADLKSRMVEDGLSLGQAIKAERNDVDDVPAIVLRAERDAQVIVGDADETARKKAAKAPKTPKPGRSGGR